LRLRSLDDMLDVETPDAYRETDDVALRNTLRHVELDLMVALSRGEEQEPQSLQNYNRMKAALDYLTMGSAVYYRVDDEGYYHFAIGEGRQSGQTHQPQPKGRLQ